MLKRILNVITKKQLAIQSIVLWCLAFINIGPGNTFWFFAIPAIMVGGLQDVIDELRILNKTEHES